MMLGKQQVLSCDNGPIILVNGYCYYRQTGNKMFRSLPVRSFRLLEKLSRKNKKKKNKLVLESIKMTANYR